MMQAEYRREDHKTYFVVKDSRINLYAEGDKEDKAYDLEMLCENRMKGLLPVSIHSFNGETELYYDISTKQTMSVLYEKKKLLKEDLCWIFSGIEKAVRELEDYFLDMECVILDMDYVYINVAERAVFLLYYPYPEESFVENTAHFAEDLLDKICNEDQETVIYAYNFYRFVKEEKSDLIAVFQRMKEGIKEDIKEESGISVDRQTWPVSEKGSNVQIQSTLNHNGRTDYDDPDDFGDPDALTDGQGDFISGEDVLYLKKDAFVPDQTSGKHVLLCRRKRIMIFGFLILTGLGVMAFAAWKYNLDVSGLLVSREGIAGGMIIAAAILGFIIFELCDIWNKKKAADFIEKEKKEEDTEPQNTLYESLEPPADWEDEADCDCATVLLQENCYTEQRILVGKVRGRQRQIDLSSFPFVIGKNKEQADYVIDDPSISRLHARFTLRDEIVYLTDLNSTNGSMKNGIRLQPNELVELQAGDEIRFGKVTFTYQ